MRQAIARSGRMAILLLPLFAFFSDGSGRGVLTGLVYAEESEQSVSRVTVLRRLAAKTFAAHDYAKAAAYYEEALQNKGTLDRREQLDYAKSLELTKEYDKALAVLQAILKAHPDDREALDGLAAIQMSRRDFTQALLTYKRLTELEPEQEAYALSYAKTLLWAGKPTEAEAELNRLLVRSPKRQEYLALQAEIVFTAKDYGRAATLYAVLAERYPQQAIYQERTASAFQYAKKSGEAWPYYEWLREHKALTPELERERADAANALKRYAEALMGFENYLKMKPDNPGALQGLLDAQLGLKRFAEARSTAKVLLAATPNDPARQLQYAEICVWSKDYTDAIPLLAKLAEKPEAERAVRELYADALFWGGEPQKATPIYRRILEDAPKDNNLRFKLADAAMGAQDFPLAKEQLAVLAQQNPDDASLEARLIQTLYLSGDKDEALERLQKYIDYAPPNKDMFRLAGDLEAEKRNFTQSVSYYQRAIEAGDDWRDTRVHLARVLSWNRQYKQAYRTYDELLQEQPEDWKVRREKARVYGWERKYGRSLAEYDKMVEKGQGGDAVKFERMAKGSFYAQRDRNAIASYKKVLADDPENLEALFDLGQVYSRQSMWGPARETYERALAVYPKHFQAAESLDRVNRIENSFALTPTYSYDRRKSSSRETDIQIHTATADLGHWFHDRFDVGLEGGYERYALDHNEGVNAGTMLARGRLEMHPDWDFSLAGGLRQLGNGISAEGIYEARLRAMPLSFLPVELYSLREDFYQNSYTVNTGIYQLKNGGRVGVQPNNNWKVNAWAEKGFFSDNNGREEVGADVQWKILPEPYRLLATWRGVYYGFRRQDTEYFSPEYFWEQSAHLDWRQYLGNEELFWGSLRTYYDFGIGYGWDKSGEPNYRLRGGLHHDVNESLSLHLDGGIQQGKEYQQQRVDFRVKVLF